MLHIILFILKIIGIILLCIIGVIILSLVCVLFVPVRYRIEITREEGEEQPPAVVRVKVTWLLHLLNILIRYPAEVMVRVRIAVFTILKMPDQKAAKEQKQGKEKKTKQKRAKENKTKKNEVNETKENKAKEKNAKEDNDKEEAKETKDRKNSDSNEQEGVQKQEKNVVESKTQEEDSLNQNRAAEETPSFLDKIRALPVILKKVIGKIKSLFENIRYTIQHFCDRIKSILDNIRYYKGVVESDAFQNSFSLCKGELAAVLKGLKPQKLEVKLIVGMDDPAATGQILAICGMLYPVLGGHIDVAGDFERKRIEGRVFIKGRIRFFTFLRAAVRIYFNKDIKRLLKLLKKEAA